MDTCVFKQCNAASTYHVPTTDVFDLKFRLSHKYVAVDSLGRILRLVY